MVSQEGKQVGEVISDVIRLTTLKKYKDWQ
jgi:hypothetical protein